MSPKKSEKKKSSKNAFSLLQQPKPYLKCPYCEENGIFKRFEGNKGLSIHIAQVHVNDPIPDLKASSSVKSKSSTPKYRLVPLRKPKPKLRRGQQRSKGRIRRTYIWKLRHVLKFERLTGTWKEKEKWLS